MLEGYPHSVLCKNVKTPKRELHRLQDVLLGAMAPQTPVTRFLIPSNRKHIGHIDKHNLSCQYRSQQNNLIQLIGRRTVGPRPHALYHTNLCQSPNNPLSLACLEKKKTLDQMEFVYLGLKDKIIDICRGEPRRAKKFKARKILANKSNESFSTNFSIMKQEREVLMAAIKQNKFGQSQAKGVSRTRNSALVLERQNSCNSDFNIKNSFCRNSRGKNRAPSYKNQISI